MDSNTKIKCNQQTQKLFEELQKNTLELDDSFKFKCRQCGNCCRDREDIVLTPYDVFRMAKFLEVTPKEIVTKYCESYVGGSSKVIVVRLKPKPIPNLLLRNPQNHKTVCPLLMNSGICLVHKAKPVVCALFPLGRYWNGETKKIQYALQNVKCGDKTETHKVRDWLKDFNIQESDKSMMIWSDFIAKASEFMNDFEKLPNEVKNLFLSAFYDLSYIKYDMNKDFIPQLETNIKEFTELIEIATQYIIDSFKKEK